MADSAVVDGERVGGLVRRYLDLGLQLGRHIDGLVDAYYGPPEPRAAAGDARRWRPDAW